MATFAVYGQSLGHRFTNYDDPGYVTQNRHVLGGLSADGAAWAWTTGHAANWHPLTWLSLEFDASLFGPNPAGFHFTNVLLHAAGGLLLYAALAAMTGCAFRSWLVAGLFLLHPLHVESAAWVAERKDVLSTFFGMLALCSYARYARSPTVRPYLAVAGAFALSLCAKPMLVTLPLVLLLLDFWPLGRWDRVPAQRLIGEKLPLLALSAASSAVTLFVQRAGGAVRSLDVVPLVARLGNALRAYAGYLSQALWPVDLAVLYPYQKAAQVSAVSSAAAAGLLTGLSVLLLVRPSRWPYRPVGWLWFLGTLVPVIGIVQVGEQAMADRYTYFPLIGIFLVAVWGAADLATALGAARVVRRAAAVAVLFACALLSARQVGFWRDSVTLWRHEVEAAAPNVTAHSELAMALADEGQMGDAVEEFHRALEIESDNETARTNFAVTLVKLGWTEEAVGHFRRALAVNPDVFEAHYGLGVLCSRRGRTEEAIDHYREALRIKPDSDQAHMNLGLDLFQLRRVSEAQEHFAAAARANPGLARAHNYLGVTLAWQGKVDEALRSYARALELEPGSAAAHNNVALALVRKGRAPEACAASARAVELAPASVTYRANYALALHDAGRDAESRQQYDQVLRAEPDWPARALASAWVLATHPDAATRSGAEALLLARQAIQAEGQERPEASQVLAAAFAECGDFGQAARKAEEAKPRATDAGLRSELDAMASAYRARQSYRDSREAGAAKAGAPRKP